MSEPSKFLKLLDDYLSSYMTCSIGASPNTIISYKYAFRLLIEFMFSKKDIPADKISFEQLDYYTLMAFFDWIEKERSCSASTKNQRLSAILSFSEYAQNRDFEAASIFRSSVIKIPMKKAQKKQRAVFSVQEIKILLQLPDNAKETGLRDKVLLSLMYASGARSQEICDLTVGNIQFNPKGATINIKGKGSKTRRIGIPDACSTILQNYIAHRRIESKPDRHVFSSQTHEQMTVSCIEGIFKKYVNVAKKENPSLFGEDSYPPHSMRHSTASHMLEAGVPIVVIKNFLGHASLQTTQIYAELSQNTVDKHLKVSIPF
ncbi:tyrosine-type recombinase/integrase [Acetobacterium wieringae]|uniref:tyrosine-type recombinase/integrase n=1 Tax=Acetobacterium wieringae TaxID=52694 RepID=UPI002B20E067|nr:tyrosine-type recombinase/integrase [Acetobacterium wieringae]MEA4805936.1 tyrosine-type recombinase/integrase [Acetobacterium wieringae]